MNEKLLSVKNLKVYYSQERNIVKAVDGVDLDIYKGESVGLVGESGCGKSTMAFSILRLLPTNAKLEGEIKFEGENLLKLEDKKIRAIRSKKISIIFQNPSSFINPIMKVGDQIVESLSLVRKLNKAELKKVTCETISNVGITSPSRTYNFYPHELSGGMKQRILIAIALISTPALIIADEPTTNLDVTVQAQVLSLIKGLVADLGSSLLLITHDLGIVAEICDRVFIMYAGKIVEYGDVFSIYENPLHPYTKALLRCALSIEELEEKLVTIVGEVPDLINPPDGCLFSPRCQYRKPICSKNFPSSCKVEPGHGVNCWLYS